MFEIIYREGDVIFLKNTGWFQKIKDALTDADEDHSARFTRAAIVTQCGTLETAMIVEARPWGFVESPLARHEGRVAVAYRSMIDSDREQAALVLDALLKGGTVRFGLGARLRLFFEAIVSERWSFRDYDPWAWLVYFIHRRALARGSEMEMTVEGVHRIMFWLGVVGVFDFVHGEKRLWTRFQ